MSNARVNSAVPAKLLPTGKFKTPESVRRAANTLSGRIVCLMKGVRTAKKLKGMEAELTHEDILKMWHSQEGRCFYSGWQMSTETNNIKLVSIERKNSAIGYTKDNCVLVAWCVNRAKNLLTLEEFSEMCIAIATHQARAFQVSAEGCHVR